MAKIYYDAAARCYKGRDNFNLSIDLAQKYEKGKIPRDPEFMVSFANQIIKG